jgi:hypothetical protein
MVEQDVTASLALYFPPDPQRQSDVPTAYTRLPVFDDVANDVTEGITRSDSPEYHLVRWQYRGHHDPEVSVRDRDPSVPDANRARRGSFPTGNPVTVDGLTIVEHGSDGTLRMRRFVDWLNVYAQLGMAFEGRPIGLGSSTEVPPPTPDSA